jgi:hypothetical protein
VITKTTLHSMRKLATKKTNTLNLMKLQTPSSLLTKSDENLPKPIFKEKAALICNNERKCSIKQQGEGILKIRDLRQGSSPTQH